MYDVSCALLSKVYETDIDGNVIIENGREKYQTIKNEVPIISREDVWKDEFYKANAQGLRPSLRLKMSVLNYNDEENLIYMGKEYTVIRTDDSGNLDEIILVCERRTNNVKKFKQSDN